MFDSQDTPETDALAAPAPEAKTNGNRKALFAGLGAVVLLGAAGYGAYYALVGSHHVETDNAYVGAYVAQVTPLVGGPVRSVAVNDTQAVKQGQVLVVLDDTDARIALASAQADLATAQRKVRGYLATDQSLSAQIAARDADQVRAAATLASARSDLDRTRVDLDRR
jgi:membrane fusion protein (multidrug efflux system)